jgi:uncharacterized protein involved in outer membrane biogenesis
MAEGRRRRWPFVLGAIVLAVAAAVALFRWDWLIPLVDRQASAALGRTVTIQHLHVKLGRVPHIVADGVTIANPPDWPGGGDFGTIEHLALDFDLMAYLHGRHVVLPAITVDHPVVDAQQLADGKANWSFGSGSSGDNSKSGDSGVQIGRLEIDAGQARVRSAKLNADFRVEVATQAGGAGGADQIVASANGTYAKQPITAQFTGGALLSLRDANQPYPIDLRVATGPTKVALTGTVQDPLAFSGANV